MELSGKAGRTKGTKMNALEIKAEELVGMAAGFGVKAEVLSTPNYVRVEFFKNLYSFISFTDTGKVRVESIERYPAKSQNVSLKALPEYVSYLAGFPTLSK
jgi:hypothetical protein